MSALDSLFQRYRNSNLKKQGKINPEPNEDKKFGSDALKKNPNLTIFDNSQNNIADIVDKRSIVSQYQTATQITSTDNYFSSVFSGMQAMPLYTNKTERIKQYRAMAQYPECDFCLCELADDFIHIDQSGQFIRLTIPEEKTHLNSEKRKILQLEFQRFIELFKFKDEAFNFFKRFLIDGEVAFENIINPEKPGLGIIGVKYLPTEYYETIYNPENGKSVGILFNKENLTRDLKYILSNNCLNSRQLFNNTIQYSGQTFNDKENSIPILWPQLTYISSGDTSIDGLTPYPLIEKCKQSYHQLALMQDAAVILRVTRAPERLLFNISTGGQPDKVARQKIKDFINEVKSKKIISSSNPDGSVREDIASVYNPISMLETFFFGKSNANDGTTIDSIGSTADYEQIADVEFFLRRLFKSFKVPFSRYKAPENSLERDETITYEEYSMARSIIRYQRRFALGLKRSFITNLKLIGLWKKYKMREIDFQIDFTPPILYDLYQKQKMINAQMDTYKAIVDNEEFSKINAMKKILNMTEEEIDENFKYLIKEKQYVAIADYYSNKISDENRPLDYKSPLRLNGVDGETQDGNEQEKEENVGIDLDDDSNDIPPEESPEESPDDSTDTSIEI